MILFLKLKVLGDCFGAHELLQKCRGHAGSRTGALFIPCFQFFSAGGVSVAQLHNLQKIQSDTHFTFPF